MTTKATGKATPEQTLFIERVSAQGGLAFVFRTLDELIENVESEL